ncbi:unnamed protein product [Prorocentrum cordatum]|uniref:Uncharacterized protein n=1 Tax=Prorocentrum cordatum TaxID=2364126 RepID=A0ABN9TZD5_9DINO|nr:unnamed protein product [Polarella glacialis]
MSDLRAGFWPISGFHGPSPGTASQQAFWTWAGERPSGRPRRERALLGTGPQISPGVFPRPRPPGSASRPPGPSKVQTAISSRRESSVHLQCSPLSDLFFEAVEESPHPGDKALGLANWLYASYVAWWHQSSNTECPLRKNKDLRRRAAVTPSSPRADASGALTCRLGMASMDIANYSRLETMC